MNYFFLKTIEKSINTYLNLDPHSKTRLKKIQGKAVSIELLPFHTRFHCTFTAEGVHVQKDELLSADTTIRGTPIQLFCMTMAKENRQHFFADDLTILGDAVLGQQVIELFDELDMDWEEYVSHYTGDVIAHHLGEFSQQFKQWTKKLDENFSQKVSLYIHEEARWQPSCEEVQDFFADIDLLRMDVDRAEARMNDLQHLIDLKENQ